MQYLFGSFVLDTEQYELRHAGDLVALEPKAYQVLTYLVQHRDRLVTRRELLAQAWPDVVVDRLAVARCISSIRRAVGDSAEAQKIILTRRGHGYRFVAEVVESGRAASPSTRPVPPVVRPNPEVSTNVTSATQATERQCFACQHDNPSSARFCIACGLPLSMTCAACNERVPVSAKFCPGCGQPLSPSPDEETSIIGSEDERPVSPLSRAEHKVVSICYGRVSLASGSSTSLGREVLYELQQAMARMITQVVSPYGGELYELDSRHFVVIFGAPEAMEDHAQRAVFAALAILQYESEQADDPHARLSWQIGIHSGLVVIGPSTSGLPHTMSVSGDVLQGAAALADQASVGTLLLSDVTSRWIPRRVQLEPAAAVPIPDLSISLSAFRVRWQPSTPPLWTTRPMRQHTRFIGRETEVERLQHHLDLAFEGQGQIVSLVGEPGIGKTRLLSEFIQSERGREMICLMSSCHAYGQNTPYFSMTAMIRRQLSYHDRDDQEISHDVLGRMLQSLQMATADNISNMRRLLDTPDGAEPGDGRSAQQRRQQTFAMLHQFFIRTSEQQPLVLAIDDLQWIDATSLDFLRELSEQIGGMRVLLLVSARPGYPPFWPTTSYVSQLSLTGLTEAEGRGVVQSIGVSAPLADATRQQIVKKARGNPFFLEELTRAVAEQDDGEAVIAVPDTVQAVLSARIDRLPSETKRLLVIAAVIGPEAPLPLFKAIAALPEAEVEPHLRRLQTAEFLYVTGYGADATIVFKHILTQEVAYHSLLTRDRQQLHQHIAQASVEHAPERIERQPEWVAYHFTEAGLTEQAVTYWQLAGQRANDRSAYVEAITHLQAGLGLLASLPETTERVWRELSLQLELASAQIAIKGYTAPEVAHTYARMYDLSQQVDAHAELFPILLELARFDAQRGALQQSLTTGEQLLAIAVHQKDAVRLQQAHWVLGQTRHYLGDIASARTHLTSSMSFYAPRLLHTQADRDLAGVQIASLFFVSLDLWALGCPEQALTHCREALTLAVTLAHPFTLALARYGMALIHQLRREPQAVLEQTEALLILAGEQQFSPYFVRGRILQGWAFTQQGQIEDGIRQIQHCLEAQRHEIDEAVRINFLSLFAEACYLGKQTANGLNALTDALTIVDQTGLRFYAAELCRLRGELALQQEDLDEKFAESCFHHALEAAHHQQAKSWALRAAMSLSRLWRLQGKRDMAHELLAGAYRGFSEGFDTADLQEAKALLETLT